MIGLCRFHHPTRQLFFLFFVMANASEHLTSASKYLTSWSRHVWCSCSEVSAASGDVTFLSVVTLIFIDTRAVVSSTMSKHWSRYGAQASAVDSRKVTVVYVSFLEGRRCCISWWPIADSCTRSPERLSRESVYRGFPEGLSRGAVRTGCPERLQLMVIAAALQTSFSLSRSYCVKFCIRCIRGWWRFAFVNGSLHSQSHWAEFHRRMGTYAF